MSLSLTQVLAFWQIPFWQLVEQQSLGELHES